MNCFTFLRHAALCLLAAATLGGVSLAPAQQYWLGKPIKLMVALAPGGGTDIAAHVGALHLLGEAALDQPIDIDRRVGAGGIDAIEAASRAVLDGCTFVIGSSTTKAAKNFLYKNQTLDPFRDFVPLAILGTIDFALLAPASLTMNTLLNGIANTMANPGKLSYGFGSSAVLLCGEMFNTAAGIEIVKVPYKGTPQSLTDLAADRLQLVCEPLGTSMTSIKAGKLRALAVSASKRNGLALEVPTKTEAGLPIEHEIWAASFAQQDAPRRRAAFEQRNRQGDEPSRRTGEDHRNRLYSASDKLGRVWRDPSHLLRADGKAHQRHGHHMQRQARPDSRPRHAAKSERLI